MELGKLGVWCFTDPLTPAQLIELAQQTERLGYSALWYPEALSYESFSLGSFLLHETKTLIIATGIANIYARDATAPPLEDPPPTVLAALGPRMTALAAARTAGAMPYNVTPEHTARSRALIG